MKKPKILLFDIETFPNVGYTWGKYDQQVIKFVKHWELASFAYKFLGDKTVHCLSRNKLSEKELVTALYKLMGQADIIVAHNGDSFDVKKARSKFLQFGLQPYALNRTVDTKKIARSQFGFVSNSLNDLADFLGLGRKVQTGGFDLWDGCMSGDKAAWAKMEKYNKQDVVLLEKIYQRLKPWFPSHPSVAVLRGRVGCPTCGSPHVTAQGYRVAVKKRVQRLQCQACGAWFTGKAVHV